MVTPVAKRQAVAHLCSSFEVSQRRACEVIRADRSSVRYVSLRPDDAAIRSRLRELASVRRRFGYRRLLLMPARRRHPDQPQKAEAVVCGGAASGSPAWRTQKSAGKKGSIDSATGTEPALVTGLRQRYADRQPPVSHPGCRG